MRWYTIEPRKTKYVKGCRYFSFSRKYEKQLLDTELDALKTASKKLVHKAGKFVGNKIADTIVNSNDDTIVEQEPVEEIIIPLEKIDEMLSNLRKIS